MYSLPQLIKESRPLLITVIVGAYLIGGLFVAAGIWLSYLRVSGSTEITFFREI
jgi:hypothetical protein